MSSLLLRAGEWDRVDPASASWRYLSFEVERLRDGEEAVHETGGEEVALVPLGGRCAVASGESRWELGGRASVFEGMPWALYLPRESEYRLVALGDVEVAVCGALADERFEPRLVTPEEVEIEVRGSGNATRQINHILKPEFPAHRLLVVEVFTPAGNWSSYPPHKHDIHKTDAAGNVLEADLEEIYYYKLDRPEGYAFQRIYTDPESPLHRAGYPIDAVVLARDNDAVIVPEGYHPVASPPGYTTYYLNVLAGSAQSLANSDDPQYAWVKESYATKDPRVPIYSISQQ